MAPDQAAVHHEAGLLERCCGGVNRGHVRSEDPDLSRRLLPTAAGGCCGGCHGVCPRGELPTRPAGPVRRHNGRRRSATPHDSMLARMAGKLLHLVLDPSRQRRRVLLEPAQAISNGERPNSPMRYPMVVKTTKPDSPMRYLRWLRTFIVLLNVLLMWVKQLYC
jgi:hypothetical protein